MYICKHCLIIWKFWVFFPLGINIVVKTMRHEVRRLSPGVRAFLSHTSCNFKLQSPYLGHYIVYRVQKTADLMQALGVATALTLLGGCSSLSHGFSLPAVTWAFGSRAEAELFPKINNDLRWHVYFDFSPIGIL